MTWKRSPYWYKDKDCGSYIENDHHIGTKIKTAVLTLEMTTILVQDKDCSSYIGNDHHIGTKIKIGNDHHIGTKIKTAVLTLETTNNILAQR